MAKWLPKFPLKWLNFLILALTSASYAQSSTQSSNELLSAFGSCLSQGSNSTPGDKANCIQNSFSTLSPLAGPQLQTGTDQLTQLYTNTYLTAVQNQQNSSGGLGGGGGGNKSFVASPKSPQNQQQQSQPTPPPATPPSSGGINYY